MRIARCVLSVWCLLMGTLIILKISSGKNNGSTWIAPERTLRQTGVEDLKNSSRDSKAKRLAWQAIESNNYQTYMDNLRAAGCPEETVRDIISSDVNKYYEQRLKKLHPEQVTNNFWEFHSTPGVGSESEFARLERQLSLEKKELLTFLLGADWEARGAQRSRDPYENGFLNRITQEQRDQIRAISDKYSQLRSELFRKGGGFFDEDLKSDLAALTTRQRGELAMTLSQDELEQWELRYSETARGIRFSSGDFQPTEQEFKTLFNARRMMEESGYASNKADSYLRTALGQSRYEEYQREQDRDFQNLKKIAGRFGIPPGVKDQVYALKYSTESASRELRNDISLSQDARNSKLEQLKQSVTSKITSLLGERAAKACLRDAGWVRNLQ
jgi:hypothetical protein